MRATAFRYGSPLNYVFYQAGWFACVLGAAASWPWVGFALAGVLLAAHLLLSVDRHRELQRIGLAVVVGSFVELLQIAFGTYQFTSGTVHAALPPPWLLIMWAQMATTFEFSLRPIIAMPWRAAMFGAVGGPLAFLAGERLGAVALQRPLTPGLMLLSLSWAIAMVVLALGERTRNSRIPKSGSQARDRTPHPSLQ